MGVTVTAKGEESKAKTEALAKAKAAAAFESGKLLVEREKFKAKKNGKEYYAYIVRGIIKGRTFDVDLAPPDKGGYEVLDLVFELGKPPAELVLIPFEFEDKDTGEKVSGTTYEVQSADEDGTVYKSAVKPARTSDKNLLDMLLAAYKKKEKANG